MDFRGGRRLKSGLELITGEHLSTATFSLSARANGISAGIRASSQASQAAGGLQRSCKNWLLVDVPERMWRQKVFSSGTGPSRTIKSCSGYYLAKNDCRVERPYNDGSFDIHWRVAVVGRA